MTALLTGADYVAAWLIVAWIVVPFALAPLLGAFMRTGSGPRTRSDDQAQADALEEWRRKRGL